MRILFTFAGGSGHLEPLVPIAQAAAAAGHSVAFAGRPWMQSKVAALGFPAFAAGSDVGLTPKRLPLVPVDLARDVRDIGQGFGRRIARERAADLMTLCTEWQPDLLVCEETDFGPMVVAEHIGLPFATVLVIAAGSFVRADTVAEPLNDVRAEYALPADPTLAMLGRYLILSPFPPSYRDPAFPLPANAYAIRIHTPVISDSPVPRWFPQQPDAPLVYFTLGTIYNMESGDLFQRVLAGVRDLPINVLLTVGRDIDPAEFGSQPAHIRIERYIPQAEIMPYCTAAIVHGGSGSVLGALTHGLPMLLIPMGADQPLNAARCSDLGVGLALDAISTTPADVRVALSELLTNPSYRQAAERLRAEIASLPDPMYAVSLLERLGANPRSFASFAAS